MTANTSALDSVERISVDLDLIVALDAQSALDRALPLFHRWIVEQTLLLRMIDVVDYRHLHRGPGVILVCHEAHISLARRDAHLLLSYRQKRSPHRIKRFAPRVAAAVAQTLGLVRLIGQTLDELTLGQTLRVRIEDRLRAANTAVEFSRVVQALAELTGRHGATTAEYCEFDYAYSSGNDPREPLAVEISIGALRHLFPD